MQGAPYYPPIIRLPEDHNYVPSASKMFNGCEICAHSRAQHPSQVPKPDSPVGPWWIWNKSNHPFRQQLNGWFCVICDKDPMGHWERIEPMSTVHHFKASENHPRLCEHCGREINDYDYHLRDETTTNAVDLDRHNIPDDFRDKVTFSSGATSGGVHAPYSFMAWEGVRLTALRYEYGNQKHEDGQNVLAEANWLKAFHKRDIAFFQDRMTHAIDHLQAEASGHRDKAPGGNWGAVGWCQDVLPFVAKYDPEFYAAVTRITPHPGERKEVCQCPRCQVMMDYYNKGGMQGAGK